MNKSKFKILSLDGGGLRGVITLTMLKKVEEIINCPIHEKFDLISGTSTGGLIANALALGISVDEILKVYIEKGKVIFPHKNKTISTATNVFKPKYSDDGIDKVLKEILGEKKMSDLKTEILIPSYDLNTSKPLFFKSRRKNEYNFRLYDICRATSAAPTYLPSYQFLGANCIDGGVYCNNPSMAALAEVIKHYDEYGLDSDDENNIYILSIGTGRFTPKIDAESTRKKGQLYWAQIIPNIMMSGVNEKTDYEVSEMLPSENYMRLNVEIKEEKYSEIDDASTDTLNYLIEQAEIQLLSKDIGKLKSILY